MRKVNPPVETWFCEMLQISIDRIVYFVIDSLHSYFGYLAWINLAYYKTNAEDQWPLALFRRNQLDDLYLFNVGFGICFVRGSLYMGASILWPDLLRFISRIPYLYVNYCLSIRRFSLNFFPEYGSTISWIFLSFNTVNRILGNIIPRLPKVEKCWQFLELLLRDVINLNWKPCWKGWRERLPFEWQKKKVGCISLRHTTGLFQFVGNYILNLRKEEQPQWLLLFSRRDMNSFMESHLDTVPSQENLQCLQIHCL